MDPAAGLERAYSDAIIHLDHEIVRLSLTLGAVLVQAHDLDIYGQWVGPVPPVRACGVPNYLFKTLPLAADRLGVDEDCHVVCIGSTSPDAFWAYAAEMLGIEEQDLPLSGQNSISLPPALSRSTLVRKVLGAVRLRLVYCHRPLSFNPPLTGSYLIHKDSIAGSDALAMVYDQQSFFLTRRIAEQEGNDEQYDTIYNTSLTLLYKWARECGIMSPDLGLMSTECLMQMLTLGYGQLIKENNGLLIELSDDLLDAVFSTDQLLLFFSEPDIFSDARSMSVRASSGRDVAQDISPEGVATIYKAFRASRLQFVPGQPEATPSVYSTLKDYKILVGIRFMCWVPKKAGYVTTLIPDALVAFQKFFRKSDYRVHIYPYPVDRSEGDPDELHVESFLPIGFATESRGYPDMSNVRHMTKIKELIRGFENLLRYDRSFWVIVIDTYTATSEASDNMAGLRLGPLLISSPAESQSSIASETMDAMSKPLGTAQGSSTNTENLMAGLEVSHTTPELSSTVPENSRIVQDIGSTIPAASTNTNETSSVATAGVATGVPETSRATGKSPRTPPAGFRFPAAIHSKNTEESPGSFRTAKSAMDRLKWDRLHRRTEYEVGYKDRSKNELMWKDLDKWEKYTEEEEFIPEHRIKQIRSKQEMAVVWDREKRADLIAM